MNELTLKHIEFLKHEVGKAGLTFSHLQDDLIDHVCCDVEYEMQQGASFEKAYERVKKRIGIDGLQRIQENTLLLIDNKYRIMKTTMKIFGVIAPTLMAFGSLFKIEQWPGGSIILALGFFLLLFVFLPSALIVSYKEVYNRTKLFIHLSGFVSAFLLALSFLFIIQHWPGTNYLLLTALLTSVLLFLPSFFIHQIKDAETNALKIALIAAFVGAFAYCSGFYLKIMHLPGAGILLLFGIFVLVVFAIPRLVYLHYKNHESVSSRFIFLTFAIIWFIIPTGLLSLNSSNSVIDEMVTYGNESKIRIAYLEHKNDKLYNTLRNTGQEVVKEKVTRLKQESDSLYHLMQQVKVELVEIELHPAESVVTNGDVNINKLNTKFEWYVGQQVLYDEGKAKLIKENIEKYRISVNQLIDTGSVKIQLINSVLNTTDISTKKEKSLRSWEDEYLSKGMFIICFNSITNLQEKVRTAENLCLKSLLNKK